MSATRRSVSGLILATLFLGACDSAGKQSTCAELVQAEEFESAVEQCAQDFRSGDDTAAGIRLVEALYTLERYERVLATADRLVGTPREAEARVFAGMAHRELGDIDSSIHSFERAATLQRDGGETRSLASSLYWLFYLNYWHKSRLRESLEYASALYEVGLELDDVDEQRLGLSALFSVFHDLGDLAATRWALSRERELIDPEDKTAVAYNFSYQGSLFSDEGRVALARDAHEKSLRLALEIENRGIARASHLNLVDVHLRLGDLDRAEEHLQGAARQLEPGQEETAGLLRYRGLVHQAHGDLDAARTAYEKAIESGETQDDWRWDIEYRLGQLAAARGDKRQAEAAFRRAIEVVERMRSSLGGDSLKAWLLDKKRQPYEALFALQVSESRNRDALETLERAKARAFLDALIHSASTDERIVEDSDDLPAAMERLGALRSVLPAMTESPVVVPRPIKEVLAALGDRQVLIYYIAGDRPWLISVSGGEARILELDRPAEEMRRLARRFRADPDAADVAEELADSLLPSSMMPEPGSRLTIVTDDFLGEIPYAALRRAGRYLVQDHVLSYAPSLTALTVIDGRSRVAGGSAIVLGDPAGDLAGAAREAEEVASMMGVEAHVGGDASLATFRAARAAPLLHVASHTGLGPSGPWLALAEGPVGIDAILADRIGPQVVVLASCSSAAREGKGLWGSLGAGFLAAGSRQVLASLWSVDDHGTREFIRRFYAEGGATDSAGALARVQRIWVAGNRRAFDWAPYVVLGAHEETRDIADEKEVP